MRIIINLISSSLFTDTAVVLREVADKQTAERQSNAGLGLGLGLVRFNVPLDT